MNLLVRAWHQLTHYRADPRPIPPRGRRRAIVLTISALLVATLVLVALVSELFLVLAVLVGSPLAIWFGRSATRNMTIARDAPLDEWQRDQVMRAYRTSYLIISGVALLVGVVLANLDLNINPDLGPVDFSRVAGVLFVLGVYAVPWIPVAVLGWRLPDEEVEISGDVAVKP
jgi:MFS family permease